MILNALHITDAPRKGDGKMQWKTIINYTYFWQQLGSIGIQHLFICILKNKIKEHREGSSVPDHGSGMAVVSGPHCEEPCCVTLVSEPQLINKTAMTKHAQFLAYLVSSWGQCVNIF